jgi:hypothetical protein
MMPDDSRLAGAIVVALAISLIWGRALGYLHDRSAVFRRVALATMGCSTRPAAEIRALLLAAVYYSLGLAAIVGMMLIFDVPVTSLTPSSGWHVWAVLLGVVGEISLAGLFVELLRRLTATTPERFAEIHRIPWIVGLRQLPAGTAAPAAALGGVLEELFYRGVLLTILVNELRVAPLAAVAVAGALFLVQQLLQVQTRVQAMVLGAGCAAISLVGGLLVVATGSSVPAVLSHASFVVFYLGQQSDRPGVRRGVPEAVSL